MNLGADDSDAFSLESARTWIAHELHDGLMQWIVGAKLHTEAMLAESRDGKSPSTEQLDHLVRLLSTATTEGRRMLAGLRPLDLDNDNWHDAIRIWLRVATVGFSAKVTLDLSEESVEVPDSTQRAAYRITQEAIGNALRHSAAENIRVRSSIESDNLLLCIEDDGCGFDIDKVERDRFGLTGIRERAKTLGGSAAITSTPGAGTKLKVALPFGGNA